VVCAGVGYGALIAAAWLNIFYIVVLAWALYYLVASMAAELPWASCNNWWNTASCRPYDQVCSVLNATASNDTDTDTSNCPGRANFTSPVREYWEYVFTDRYLHRVPKTYTFLFFEQLLSKVTDFNDFWYVKS